MRKINTVSKGELLNDVVPRLVERGRYGHTSEMMRAGLHLLKQRAASDEMVRKAVIGGLGSTESELTLRGIADQQAQCITSLSLLWKTSQFITITQAQAERYTEAL